MGTVKKVVIVGGGTAGWMCAAALSKLLGKHLEITLVESDEIGTVGVGEATIPTLQGFNRLLGIDEQTFMKEVQATFKLGIQFENWQENGSAYIHSFGKTGKECWAGEFHHFWLKAKSLGFAGAFGDYCPELEAAKQQKFALLSSPFSGGQGNSSMSALNYAYHIDASLYAKFLRRFSEARGVVRREGRIAEVQVNHVTGEIEAVLLQGGEHISGQLFIDCSGFKGLLIEEALHTGYEDWSHWLPCDSAIAVQTTSVAAPLPYTRAIARSAGWQWRIPLQHRVGNGFVFCRRYMSESEAKALLLDNVEGDLLTEPRALRFTTGRRRKAWNKNCVALGLASGFVEPLESTSIHLIMSGIVRLMRLFPHSAIHTSDIDEYNAQTKIEIERIRDFIILHYCETSGREEPFWRYCQRMELPASLQHRLSLFSDSARVFRAEDELFRVDSWTQVMLGQGRIPKAYHPIVDNMSDEELASFLQSLRAQVRAAVDPLPMHHEFVENYCPADFS